MQKRVNLRMFFGKGFKMKPRFLRTSVLRTDFPGPMRVRKNRGVLYEYDNRSVLSILPTAGLGFYESS